MRGTNRWSRAGLLLAMLLVGVTALGRPARAQDERSSGDAWLGVMTQELTDQLREGLEIDGRGVLVARVVDGSPADRAGIEKGDVIARVNSRAVGSPEELARIVRDGRVGQDVSIEIVRDGRSRTLTATLGARPGADSEGEGMVERNDRDRDEMKGDREEQQGDRDQAKKENRQDKDEMDMPDMPNMPDMDHMPMIMGRGRLGVRIEDLSGDDRGRDRVSHGARVSGVVPGSAAEKAGLRAGDIIVRVDDQNIDDRTDLVRTIQQADRHVRITYVRRGATRTTEADLEDLPRVRAFRFDRGDLAPPAPDGDRRTIVRRGLDRSDAEDLRREVRELRRQVDELRKQLDELQRR